MLKLEAGKRYWRRDGGVSAVLHCEPHSVASMRFHDGLLSWCKNGEYFTNKEQSPYDLVREYTEPQPLQWKRGIPTEEECRECWIVTGGYDKIPDSNGAIHKPSEHLYAMWGDDACWYVALRIQPVEPPKTKTKTVTQRQYFNAHGEELWTDFEYVASTWTASGMARTREVQCD